jgi:predicted TPR repeat methyltransferase
MKIDKPYSEFARVYDLMGADRHSAEMVEYTQKIIRRFRIEATSLLDLCCGTGTALKLFCDNGFTVSGLDGSARMLAIATKKLKGHKVTLYNKTLPRFRLLHPENSRKVKTFDLITSFYDSLNYMKNITELGEAFTSTAEHLTPEGWFIFDMNTPTALKTIWGEEIYADAREDMAWIWKNRYDAKTQSATLMTTFFEKDGSSWRRFDEQHDEYAYSNTVIKKLLKNAGFKIKGLYRCFTFKKPTRATTRICVVAQKQ